VVEHRSTSGSLALPFRQPRVGESFLYRRVSSIDRLTVPDSPFPAVTGAVLGRRA
jgi:hypothetical protein